MTEGSSRSSAVWLRLAIAFPVVVAGACAQGSAESPDVLALRAYSAPFRTSSERDSSAPPQVTVFDTGLTVVDRRSSPVDPPDLVALDLGQGELGELRSLLEDPDLQPVPAALPPSRSAAFATLFQVAAGPELVELVAFEVDVADEPDHNPFGYRDEILRLDAEISRLADLVVRESKPFRGQLPSVRVVGGLPEG